MADPCHTTTLVNMYRRADSRAQLDAPRHDRWSAELCQLCNSTSYCPHIPEGVNGVTEDTLLAFEPTKHPVERPGSFLKDKWRKLRTQYTVARRNFDKSGQGQNDAFPDFTDSNDMLSYMHCVCFGQPSLEMIVRIIPAVAQMECGIRSVRQPADIPNIFDDEDETPQKRSARQGIL